ncbi:MAG: lanthionine synthetase LanC family protein [Flavobacterium sp.]
MQNIVFEIEKQIWATVPKENRIGILNGLSGIALFYNSLLEIDNNNEFQEKLIKIIERINDIISDNVSLPSFCSGLAGYGWVLLRINNEIIDIDEDYFLSLDEILLEELTGQANEDDYDFLHGSLGISMYFVERFKQTKDESIKRILIDYITELIGKISKNLEGVLIREDGVDKCHYIYFGMAHGIAGVINIMLYIKQNLEVQINNFDESIRTCIDYLNKFKGYNDKSKQFYPNHYLTENKTFAQSRLSWCQGDLGIGNALYNAGLFFKDAKLQIEGAELIEFTKKISLTDSGVKDFGICHGTTGIIMQYYLAGKRSESDYQSVISIWLDILRDQTNDFTSFLAMNHKGYLGETNILEGSAGLGLVLLSLDDRIKPDWLNCLNLY